MSEEKNNSNTLPCGQLGDGEDDELSMVDVLNEQARLEEHADAVLGDSDAKNCTFPKGYLSRQALYACATCTPDGNAGVCLACSYACHEGHELYEIYTKRDFRCDCGNEKFGAEFCKLYADKGEPNSKNKYSQNFKGLYCSCNKPYPDPDDDTDDEMIQCVICEDWLHGRHLKIALHEPEFTEEMVCPGCMAKLPFLWAYQVDSEVTKVAKVTEVDAIKVDVEASDSGISSSSQATEGSVHCSQISELPAEAKAKADCTNGHKQNDTTKTDSISHSENDNNSNKRDREESLLETTDNSPVKKIKTSHSDVDDKSEPTKDCSNCLLESLNSVNKEVPDRASFWQDGWRQKLCKCDNCLAMYKDKRVEFLLDPSDTVQAYEERGKARDEEGTGDLLAGLGRVQQIEVVRGMVDMKTQLSEFLLDFAREGKVVTESDIRQFFQGMEQRRRQGQVGVPQPFCR